MKCKYNKKIQLYTMGDWEIRSFGGFCTVKHFWASNIKSKQQFWMFKLKDVKSTIENLSSGSLSFEDIGDLYKRPLYS